MKFYSIIGIITTIIGILITSFIYVIKSERKIKTLQQENLVYKINEEQSKIELKNNKILIEKLKKQMVQQEELSELQQIEIKKTNKEIQNMSSKERINVINSIFK